jgi:hypothetical protein
LIRFIDHKDINKKKWDECISKASNGLIYGYSYYLEHMSKHWDGLILNDYEAVMPLTWNRKYGFYYLYQPFFCQSLGLFGNNITADLFKAFLDAVPKKFKYWDIYLNKENVFTIKGYPFYLRSNYILPLDQPYNKLAASFNPKHIASIKKAAKEGYSIKKDVNIKDVISLAMQQSKAFSPVQQSDYENFTDLYNYLHKKGKAITYGAYNKDGELMSSGVWLSSHNRSYYVMAGNHPSSRTSGASHFLLDAFIKENAEKEMILDFEGSNVEGIARFFKRFGATEEKYSAIKLNKLPPLVRLLK